MVFVIGGTVRLAVKEFSLAKGKKYSGNGSSVNKICL